MLVTCPFPAAPLWHSSAQGTAPSHGHRQEVEGMQFRRGWTLAGIQTEEQVSDLSVSLRGTVPLCTKQDWSASKSHRVCSRLQLGTLSFVSHTLSPHTFSGHRCCPSPPTSYPANTRNETINGSMEPHSGVYQAKWRTCHAHSIFTQDASSRDIRGNCSSLG